MHKERITKEDGRYLIYYTFNDVDANKPHTTCDNSSKETGVQITPAIKQEEKA